MLFVLEVLPLSRLVELPSVQLPPELTFKLEARALLALVNVIEALAGAPVTELGDCVAVTAYPLGDVPDVAA